MIVQVKRMIIPHRNLGNTFNPLQIINALLSL